MNIRKPNRNNAPLEKNGRLFQSSLDILWDIEASDAIETIQKNRLLAPKAKQEDIKFYIDQQKKEKNATMTGIDKIFQPATRRRKSVLKVNTPYKRKLRHRC